MCGRMANTLPTDSVARLFSATPANDLPPVPDYNICPTQSVAVVTAEAGRRLRPMRWGFIPQWYKSPTDGPLLINARSETIAEKPAFRAAVRARRCLVPVSGFYEWHRTKEAKLPWYATRADGTPLFCGSVVHVLFYNQFFSEVVFRLLQYAFLSAHIDQTLNAQRRIPRCGLLHIADQQAVALCSGSAVHSPASIFLFIHRYIFSIV